VLVASFYFSAWACSDRPGLEAYLHCFLNNEVFTSMAKPSVEQDLVFHNLASPGVLSFGVWQESRGTSGARRNSDEYHPQPASALPPPRHFSCLDLSMR